MLPIYVLIRHFREEYSWSQEDSELVRWYAVAPCTSAVIRSHLCQWKRTHLVSQLLQVSVYKQVWGKNHRVLLAVQLQITVYRY